MTIQGPDGKDLEIRDPHPTFTSVTEAVAESLKGTFFVPDARVSNVRKSRTKVEFNFFATFKNEKVTIEIYEFEENLDLIHFDIYVERELISACHYSNKIEANLLKEIILITIKNLAFPE